VIALPDALVGDVYASALYPFVGYELEPTRADAAERATDGGFETWNSATDLASWSESTGGGTVNREAVIIRSGTYSAALARTPGSTALLQISQASVKVIPGKWYRIEVYARASADVGSAVGVKVTMGSKYVLSDGTTWSTSTPTTNSLALATSDCTTAYKRVEFWFQADPAATTTTTATLAFKHSNTAGGNPGGTVYFDDASLMGPYDRPALYYGPSSLTWNGRTYQRLALRQAPIREAMGVKVPEVTVEFDNVSNTLRSYFEPTDLLTGGRLTCRLLFRDGAGVARADSLILFRGAIDHPRRISETSFELKAVGLLHAFGQELPRRRIAPHCQWEFPSRSRPGPRPHCGYVSSTTAVGAGAASVALTLAAASTFANGDVIRVGNGLAVAIANGGGTVNLTLAEARDWSNGDAVVYDDCSRELADCAARVQKHRYGGYLGILALERAKSVTVTTYLGGRQGPTPGGDGTGRGKGGF
jgi:phage-related protein